VDGEVSMSEDTIREFVRQQREKQGILQTAVLGVLGAAVLALAGAGLSIWRDQYVQAETIRRMDESTRSLAASIKQIEGATEDLKIAIRILEVRNAGLHPEVSYAPAVRLNPAEEARAEAAAPAQR